CTHPSGRLDIRFLLLGDRSTWIMVATSATRTLRYVQYGAVTDAGDDWSQAAVWYPDVAARRGRVPRVAGRVRPSRSAAPSTSAGERQPTSHGDGRER